MRPLSDPPVPMSASSSSQPSLTTQPLPSTPQLQSPLRGGVRRRHRSPRTSDDDLVPSKRRAPSLEDEPPDGEVQSGHFKEQSCSPAALSSSSRDLPMLQAPDASLLPPSASSTPRSSSSSSSSPPNQPPLIPMTLQARSTRPSARRAVVLCDVPAAVMQQLPGLPPTGTDIPNSCVRRWAALISAWLADLDSRLLSGKAATHAPIAAGAAIVFAVPFTAEAVHHRMTAVWEGLWQDALDLAVASSHALHATRRLPQEGKSTKRSTALMERKAVKKAIRALQPLRVLDSRDTVIASITSKIPPAPHPWAHVAPPPPPGLGVGPRRPLSLLRQRTPDEWVATVWTAVCNIGSCAAPGPSGLRREHLEAAARVPSARIIQIVADVIDCVCAGLVPADDRYLTGSALSPVPKSTPGDYRPIGVGEILRRTAARIGVAALCKHVGQGLHDARQYGVSRDGGHAVYHTIRQCAAIGEHVIEFDINNAFCDLYRECVLEVVHDIDDVRPLVEALYGNDSLMTLRGGTTTLMCDRGVVQGCPLAAVLYALAQQRAIDEARAAMSPAAGVVTDVWYADDGRAASASADALTQYIALLRTALSDRGLTLSARKTLFISPANLDADHPDVVLLAAHAHRVDILSCVGLPVCPRGQPNADALIAQHFKNVVSGATDIVSSFTRLEHPHHMVQALSMAGMWSRIQYHVRGYVDVIPTPILDTAERCDIDVLRTACGTYGDKIHIPQWAVATLPLSDGGGGICSVSVEAATHEKLCPPMRHDDIHDCPARPQSRDAVKMRQRATLATLDALRLSWTPVKMGALMDAATPGARTWLSSPLSRADGTLTPDHRVATAMIASAIGCDVLPAGYPCLRDGSSCCPSRRPGCDPYGQHVTNCPYVMTTRHNAVRDVIFHALLSHAPHLTPLREQACGNDGRPYDAPIGEARVGDVVIYDPVQRSFMYLDIAVGGLNQALVPSATLKRGVYPNSQHVRKMNDPRRAQVLATGQQHVALAFGPTGSPSYQTRKFLWTVLARALDPERGAGTGRTAAYVGLLARCQLAILQTHGKRLVELGDELANTDISHRSERTVYGVETATVQINHAVTTALNRLGMSRQLFASAHGPEPARDQDASNPTHSPHRRLSMDIDLTAPRGGRTPCRVLEGHLPPPAGASAAGAPAANSSCPTSVHSPPPCHAAQKLGRRQRVSHSPSQRCESATPDDAPPLTANLGASLVPVREHVRRHTDRTTGMSTYKLYPAHWRSPRRNGSAPTPTAALPRRDSSPTSSEQRGETAPRRLDKSSRPWSSDSTT